ncbi:MAG: CAP domain-containing protein, partial [Thermomicrobium sp.]|nr:CAP domain-containing protein [Thermomicrobium sp.]
MLQRTRRAFLTRFGVPLLLAVAAQPLVGRVSRAATDEPTLVLERINRWRSWIGLTPLQRHLALEAAAQAHAEYYRVNAGDPDLAGMGLH